MTSWWRTNLRWLLALPVAALIAGGLASYHVRTMWWFEGLHHEVGSAPVGEYVSLSADFRDGEGETSRTLRVRLLSIDPVGAGPDAELPLPGTTAYGVRLDFEAGADQELRVCQVALIGADKQRYAVPSQPYSPCLPQGHPGPEASIVAGQPRGSGRPGRGTPRQVGRGAAGAHRCRRPDHCGAGVVCLSAVCGVAALTRGSRATAAARTGAMRAMDRARVAVASIGAMPSQVWVRIGPSRPRTT